MPSVSVASIALSLADANLTFFIIGICFIAGAWRKGIFYLQPMNPL